MRRVVSLSAAIVLCCGAVALAVPAGLRLPTSAVFAPLPSDSPLDYLARFDSGIRPLRADFVRDALDLRAQGTERGVAVSRSSSRTTTEVIAGPQSHPFTNDDMANAFEIGSLPFSATTDARGATRESGEPRSCSSTGGTAWYRFTPKADTTLIATSVGTEGPVSLAVFEDAANPRQIACDTGVARSSFAEFIGRGGRTYLFQVAPRATAGRLAFNLENSGRTSVLHSGSRDDPPSYLVTDTNPSMSADGRFVVFGSYARSLDPQTPGEPCHTGENMAPGSAEELRWGDRAIPCHHVFLLDRTTGSTSLVSRSSRGEPGNLADYGGFITADGRFVAFISSSDNLVEGDTNEAQDVFVRDLVNGTTERISLSSSGEQALGGGWSRLDPSALHVSASSNGRFVSFVSPASNLIRKDTNGLGDVFVRDRLLGQTERVSVASSGRELSSPSADASISPDGRFVYFTSYAPELPGANGRTQSYLHDRVLRTTELVSLSTRGTSGDADSVHEWIQPNISREGRFVVFTSEASNLVSGDTNDARDVFLRDRIAGTTIRLSVSSAGVQASSDSFDATITDDGRYVAFTSTSPNLAGGARQGSTTVEDLFIRDLHTSTTARMAVSPHGRVDGAARAPFLSGDGRSSVFMAICADGCGEEFSQFQIWLHERDRSVS